MRILAVTNLFPNPLQPHRGTFNRQQFRALADRNPLTVIAPIAWSDEWRARSGAVALPKDRCARCDGIVVQHPRYAFPPKVLRRWYGHCFRRSIRHAFVVAVAEFQPDLILAAWAYPDGWAAIELAHEAGLPAVLKVHGSDILTLARVAGRQDRTAEAVRRADAVIAVSRDLASNVIQMGADPCRVTVIYDGVDGQRFSPGDRRDSRSRLRIAGADPILLFVGNLVPVKGVDILIDACSQLSRQGRKYRCFVIGQGPLRSALQRRILQSGLKDRVTLVGAVPHATLPDWYRAADLFVLPSYSEGVPCVLLEAAACRTPYVATCVGGIPEIAHLNRGRLVVPGDSGALACAIVQMLSEPSSTGPRSSLPRSHDDAAREMETVFEHAVMHSQRSRLQNACPGKRLHRADWGMQ
jgi:glycosyltransferase involved in cell wall biosynthesis